MRLPPIFTAYCLLILIAFGMAKYQGWTLFGVSNAIARNTAGGTRAGGGYSGFHK